MVFTVAENAAFFADLDQMAMELDTINELVNEGIDEVEDLADFDEESLKQVVENLRRPAGRIPDPTIGAPGGAVPGATIRTPSFRIGAKSYCFTTFGCYRTSKVLQDHRSRSDG